MPSVQRLFFNRVRMEWNVKMRDVDQDLDIIHATGKITVPLRVKNSKFPHIRTRLQSFSRA